ncbi:MAG TPA: transglycosylase domain-containing protein [Glycomyces sp.]|nr:transglycosylase domain-containing protein [Glycomyces sp.]
MSDYGYRPSPPPEDGRPRGRDARQGPSQGHGHGNAPQGRGGGSGDPDYGWGGGSQQQGGGYGQAPRPRPQPYGTPASGSASVGRAAGSASVGRPAGSASVPGATGSASVGGQGRSGRATVGSASVGSASVGSAAVGGARPGGDEPTGRASVTGARRAVPGKGPVSEDDLDETQKKVKKKRRRKKILAGLIGVGVLFIAGVTVVGSYFFVDVPSPSSTIARAGESSTFYYSDGATAAGGYGETLRLQAKEEEIPPAVKDALVATEDRKFWDHSGVDFVGTMRAVVNNVKGGDTQGASTITQQYAGMVMSIREEISYDRKAREAAMAIKMEQTYSKDEIITAYLNLAWFGRGATGVEAAAKVYFNKALPDLTPGEAAYIVMQVKSPDGTYDPYYGEGNGDKYNEEATKARWNYSMQAMVDEGYLTQEERDAEELPIPTTEFNSAGSWGGNSDVGFIVNELDGYVFKELQDRYGISKEDLYGGESGKGGYQVTLTIDQAIQNSLVTTGSRGDVKVKTNDEDQPVDKDGNPVTDRNQAEKDLTDEGYAQFENSNKDAALYEYDEYMMTAMVAIDPETGAVVGYYGGDNGFGVDKAGAESPHPSSSTFKMITAATAMEGGDSIESWFNADSPRKFDSLTNEDETCIGSGTYPDCTLNNGSQDYPLEMTLTDAVRDSKNTPMYSISEHYGADKILETADKMGLSMMNQARTLFDENDKPHDTSVNYQFHDDGTYTQHGQAVDAEGDPVTDASGNWDVMADIKVDDDCNPVVDIEGRFPKADAATPCNIGGKGATDPFYNHIAFGQYPTSVKDMASVYATIANDGRYNESHFVASVTDNEGNPVREVNPLTLDEQVIDKTTAQNLQWVGSEISGESPTGDELDREYFGKTGTWEASGEDEDGEKYPSGWNAHAWYVGAIPQLSIAAWVGNVTSESDPIADVNGDRNNVFGSNTAYPVWYWAMNRILDDKKWDEVKWEGKTDGGNETYWDIEEAGGPRDGGEFCAANPDHQLCASQQNEEEEAVDCEDEANAEKPECQEGDDPGDGATATPDPGDGGGEEGGEDCSGLFPPPTCEEDPSTPPTEESSEEPTDPDGNNGNNSNNG